MSAVRVATAVALASVLALAPAGAASAAGELQLSNDGVTYGSTLAVPVFASAPVLVPLQSASGSFWVRNASSVDAYLRLTLADSSWSSWDYGSGLSLTAAVPGKSGTAVGLAATPACSVILYGVMLAPGASVEVTATLTLGDKAGTTGQTGWASVDFGVTLIEAAGLSASPDCSIPSTPVVVVPPPAPRDGPDGTTTDGEVVEPDDGGDQEPDPEPGGFLAVLANTLTSFDSGIIGVASASIPLGAGLFFLVGWGRRGRLSEEDES